MGHVKQIDLNLQLDDIMNTPLYTPLELQTENNGRINEGEDRYKEDEYGDTVGDYGETIYYDGQGEYDNIKDNVPLIEPPFDPLDAKIGLEAIKSTVVQYESLDSE